MKQNTIIAKSRHPSTRPIRAVLVGNPNCGKTLLFNYLTGAKQYVGNWPGVTVEKKTGRTKDDAIELTDLPGAYSLSPYTMEEQVTRLYLLEGKYDVVINVVDGTNLERHLYLTMQLLELEVPMVVAVNLYDVVRARGGAIDCNTLERELGVPFVAISAKTGLGLEELAAETNKIGEVRRKPQAALPYDRRIVNALCEVAAALPAVEDSHILFSAARLLEGDIEYRERFPKAAKEARRAAERGNEVSMAEARYHAVDRLIAKAVQPPKKENRTRLTARIDRILLHRIWGVPLFLGIILLLFSIPFGPLGTTLSNWVELFFTDGVSSLALRLLEAADTPDWLCQLISEAVISGIGGVIVFLPQIILLFLGLTWLEDSGYMARAAFLMDRIMRGFGLSGKSFIPMLIGFGCTTPAVIAARSLENEQDRKLTVLLTPFMSCSAKLAVYALFAGTFFGTYQGLVVFSLYLLGLAVALFSGVLLSKTVVRGTSSGFLLELSSYRMPSGKAVFLRAWERGKSFLVKAGTVIFVMNIAIWFLEHFSPSFQIVTDGSESILGKIGAVLAPFLAPLGFGTWEAAVSLLAGLAAKESVVSTMTVLYAAGTDLSTVIMQVFTPLSAYTFLTFVLLYPACISAFASIRRELGTGWALFSVAYQTGVAYLAAFLIAQIGGLCY